MNEKKCPAVIKDNQKCKKVKQESRRNIVWMLQISNLDGWVEGEGKFNYLICIRIVLQKYMNICMHAK